MSVKQEWYDVATLGMPKFSAKDLKELNEILDQFLGELKKEESDDPEVIFLTNAAQNVKDSASKYKTMNYEEKESFLMNLSLLFALISEMSEDDEDDFDEDDYSDIFDDEDEEEDSIDEDLELLEELELIDVEDELEV